MTVMNKQAASPLNVPSSTSSVTVFAASGAASGRTVVNDSTAVLYLKFGAAASATSYTVQLPAGSYYEFPQPLYAGRVDGVWAAENGAARTTEW